jgi:hypothetical protein
VTYRDSLSPLFFTFSQGDLYLPLLILLGSMIMIGLPLLEAFALGIMGWVVYGAFWRLYLGPLSRFPGPKLAALTLWYECHLDILKQGGALYVQEIGRLHKIYDMGPCSAQVEPMLT